MPTQKVNCWEELDCGREPGGAREAELGPCPAATDRTCDGINGGTNAGRICWAIEGTLCCDQVDGNFADKSERCATCPLFRRVKYEEGCHFQLLKPGLGSDDPQTLHRLLNDSVALIGVCRDIFACLAERPLLQLIVQHALAITRASSAAAYVFSADGDELTLEAHAGALERPERVALDAESALAQAARTRRVAKGRMALAGQGRDAAVAAVPVGGRETLAGVLELVTADGEFSLDDEWFLREFSLSAALGIENARTIAALRELKRFDKAKSRFVALLMHHITSPLATIACSLQALSQLRHKLSEADSDQLIANSLDRINTIQTLSKRLLDLAAIRSGSSLAAVRPVCPAEPLRREVENRLPRARELGVELIVADSREQPLVLADPDGLRVIFANLLGNAVKYCTRTVKRVEAGLSVHAGRCRVSIRDTGIGIPPDDQSRVFEEFHRAANAAPLRGHGLGLAVVKELVDRYGGELELESTVGEGTTITILFPLVDPTPPA